MFDLTLGMEFLCLAGAGRHGYRCRCGHDSASLPFRLGCEAAGLCGEDDEFHVHLELKTITGTQEIKLHMLQKYVYINSI